MNVQRVGNSHRPTRKPAFTTPIKQPESPIPLDLDEASKGGLGGARERLALFTAGAAAGAVGLGAPAALGMTALKSIINGNYLVGAGYSMATLGIAAAAVVPSLGLVALSTDSGDQSAVYGYRAGALGAVAGAAYAIF